MLTRLLETERRGFPAARITLNELDLNRFENGHRDGAPCLPRVPADPGRLGLNEVAPHGVPLLAVQLVGPHHHLPLPYLDPGGGSLAQVLEPVGSVREPEPVPQTTKPAGVSRYRTQVERGMPVRRPGVVIIRTCTFLLPLDSRPSSVRYIHTPVWFPARVKLRLRRVIAPTRTCLSWAEDIDDDRVRTDPPQHNRQGP